jgi:hypothetical protein
VLDIETDCPLISHGAEMDVLMATSIDLSRLFTILEARPAFSGIQEGDLERLPDKGLAHDHVRIKSLRIRGRRPLVRLPRLSQFGLDPTHNLSYQAACFERSSQSGHAPFLIDRLEPSDSLPMGGLVVAEIEGGPVSLPKDLAGMAECLARVHLLPVPDLDARSPLANHDDPVLGIMGFIEAQAPFVERSARDPEAVRLLTEELAWARCFAANHAGSHPPARLCLTDTHPGNFLTEPDGTVYFTDLEKALYGSPAVDLGHATVLTSTLWDIDVQAELTLREIQGFYASYLGYLPTGMADAVRPWLLPMRRLTWLRSTTWSCKWYAERHRGQTEETGLRARIRDHVGGRLAAFVDVGTITRVREEWSGARRLVLD